MTDIRRAWINQPSTLQPLHKLHGTNVLVHWIEDDDEVTIYFLSGPVHSQLASKLWLSLGWKESNQ